MKRYINKLTGFFLIVALVFVACEDDENLEIIQPEAAFELEQSSASNVNLNFGLPDNPALTVTWSDDVTGSSSYIVEMAIEDTFANPLDLGSSTSNSFTISVVDLNSAINMSGTTTFDSLPIYVRVNAGSAFSNAVIYTITAYPIDGATFLSPSNGDAFVLSLDSSDEDIMTVSWDDAQPDSVGSVTYTVEAASAGTDFAAPVAVGSGTDIDNFTATHSELNAIALGAGLLPDTAGDVDMRIVATTVNSNGAVLTRISETITVSITPYNVSFPFLYFVGDATTPGWDNNNSNTVVFRDQEVPNNYTYTGYFNVGAFKLLEVLGQWQPQWGTNDGSTLAVNPGEGSDPGTFNVASAGYYTYNFTTVGEGGTFTVAPFDASGATIYNTMGLIGDSTPNGWDGDNDTNFTQDPNNPHLWFIQGVTLTAGGQFLIRANDVWDGPDSAVWRYTGSEELYGTASFDGDNFPFTGETGSYDVWFNDLTGSYAVIPN